MVDRIRLGDFELWAVRYTNFTASAMVLDSAGNVFFADVEEHIVRRIDAASGLIRTGASANIAVVGCDLLSKLAEYSTEGRGVAILCGPV